MTLILEARARVDNCVPPDMGPGISGHFPKLQEIGQAIRDRVERK